MVNPETQFAAEFRRTRACGRCSRLKTKCAYDSPDSKSCRRCERGGYVCEIATAHDRPKRTSSSGATEKRKSSGQGDGFAFVEKIRLETREATNETEIELKLKQLRKVVNEAQCEIEKLDGQMYTPKGRMSLDQDLDAMANDDVLEPLISYGIMTYDDCELFYRLYCEQMMSFLKVTKTRSSVREAAKIEPVTTLAIVVSASLISRITYGEVLTRYMERLLLERCVIRGHQSIDLLKGLLVMTHYIPQLSDRLTTVFMIAGGMAQSLALGNAEDCQIMVSKTATEEEKQAAHDRLRLHCSYNACMASMVVNSARMHLFGMVNLNTQCMDVLYQYGTLSDRLIIYAYRITMAGHEGCEALRSCLKFQQPLDLVNKTFNDAKTKLCELLEAADMLTVETGDEDTVSKYMAIVRNVYSMLYVALNEQVLNCYLFGRQRPGNEVMYNISYDIIANAQRNIDKFVQSCEMRSFMPKYHFFWPLQALTSLLRVRILLWAHNQNTTMVDVQAQLKRVKEGWETMAKSSFVAKNMTSLVSKIEQWLDVRLNMLGGGRPSPDDKVGQSEVQGVIKQVMKNHHLMEWTSVGVGRRLPHRNKSTDGPFTFAVTGKERENHHKQQQGIKRSLEEAELYKTDSPKTAEAYINQIATGPLSPVSQRSTTPTSASQPPVAAVQQQEWWSQQQLSQPAQPATVAFQQPVSTDFQQFGAAYVTPESTSAMGIENALPQDIDSVLREIFGDEYKSGML